VLPPPSWGEFGDARSGVLADPLQDIHLVQAACRKQALNNGDVFCTELCPGKKPVTPSH
jgi:hypothetical protein